MPDEKTMAKIDRVYLMTVAVKGRRDQVYKYKIWHGYYREDGKRHRVYLGRALPERLAGMIGKNDFSRRRCD